ncbi:hypothetical protein DOTSEDRAFT_74951 [Dothistroma septosporum NZE10]|uniref:Integral membrane protein n=1 Tax=Dothistroma septosporum (strain NZE10 / CBS 128990) TaxID=675120 RepID=N1PD95_DOTSN|nr:hypothetical protein DOTSEDRAFT_74951 [Dothistroma septosporum NZE10]
MRLQRAAFLTTAALLFGALQLVTAHGDEHDSMNMAAAAPKKAGEEMTPTEIAHLLPSYFRHPGQSAWHLAHLALMILAWFVAMPLAIMLSIARSRYHLPAQFLFQTLNGVGLFMGIVYSHSTPDLYQSNSHHPLGWVVTAFTILWTVMSVYVAYGEYRSSRRSLLQQTRSLTAASMAQHSQLHHYNDEISPRDSHDSGMGAERNSASLFGSRQNSSDSVHPKPETPFDDLDIDEDDEDEDESEDPEKAGFLGNNRVDRFIAKNVRRMSTQRASKIVRFLQIFTEKILLVLGFAAILSGFIVSGGLFRDRQIFSGLAHYIKGGIFFWYGLLTMGRWMGAFTEFGWAWNVRPETPLVSKWKTIIPSAEFTESFVIWLYGASNVFLEHLNHWGDAWTPSDLEHLSITILFFGGGLLGMMLESSWLRDLTNTSTVVQKSKDHRHADALPFEPRFAIEEDHWTEPKTHKVPLNPMPALTIMLLGAMMSAHHQNSMVSTMMHSQWGGLFTAFALARGVTYITLYLKPPTSHFPSRPPSEIVAAFCLTSGGLMFMNSSADTVWAVESNGLDAMTIFTVTLGLTGIILAWEVVVFAIKGWAVRRERAAAGRV